MRGKKLRGNGLWESSRMIIPEHKEAIRSYRIQREARQKPELDEQRIEELSFALHEALESKTPIRITTFAPFGDETTRGYVEAIDPITQRVKVRSGDEVVFIPFRDIVGVG